MNETAKFLRHDARRTADTVMGELIERLPNGSYRYRDVASGAERFATPNLGDEFAIGSRVRIDRPSASRALPGSQDVIVTRASREQRGLSATTATENRAGVDRVGITEVDPDPITLEAGGDYVEQRIHGFGLTAGPMYSAASGPAPTITQHFGPDITDTLVTSYPKASGLSALGEFDLSVNGARAPRAIRVVPSPAETLLFIPGARVYGVWPEKGTLVRQSSVLPTTAVRTFGTASGLIIAFYAGGGACVLPKSLRSQADFSTPQFPAPNSGCQIVDDLHGSIWYGSASGLQKVSVETGAATLIHNNGGAYEGVAYDTVHDVIFACEKSTRNVRRFDRATGTLLATVLMPNSGGVTVYPRNLIIAGTRLFVFGHPFVDNPGATTYGSASYDLATFTLVNVTAAPQQAYMVGLVANFGDDGVISSGAPVAIFRKTNLTTIGYDAIATSRLQGYVTNYVYGPVANITNFDVATVGVFGGRLVLVGRTSDASRLRIVFYNQFVTGGGPPAGQLTLNASVTCEAAVPATPMPSVFMGA